ncbi:NAD(P)-binding domain protein, partial [Metarhizium majus ARSEF 297]
MAPIRTAIIGLSSAAATSWASTAHLPALVTPAGQSKFQIPNRRAAQQLRDLAADPAVDLVICSTRVDRHHETVLPSVRAGKDVYVEWPVAATDADIRSLADEARRSSSTALVGL